MKRRPIKNRTEQQIVTGMIVNTRFLREIQPFYEARYMDIPFSQTIARWCLDYFKQYDKAPKKHIQDIYEAHKDRLDDDESDLIADFLESLSDQYKTAKKMNVDYLLDQAELHFQAKQIGIDAKEQIALIQDGDVKGALAVRNKGSVITRTKAQGINPFTDVEVIRNAFQESTKPLFTFPTGLGKLCNEFLLRESFIAWMGPEKRGKTWYLMESAYRAARARCNVAYFQVGDMSLSQVTKRLHMRIAGRNVLSKYCGERLVPVVDCIYNQDNSCRLKRRKVKRGIREEGEEDQDKNPMELFRSAPSKYKACSLCQKDRPDRFKGALWYEQRDSIKPLTWKEGYQLAKKFMMRLKSRDFKFVSYPNEGINVSGIRSQLDQWERDEGFVADCVFIDYADNLACEPENARDDFRHRQGGIWSAMSGLRLEKHCFLMTATQADIKAQKNKLITWDNFTEDKRKYGHVTGIFTLNQTDEEKYLGMMRVGLLAIREGESSPRYVAKVLQCLQRARPYLGSYT